MAVVQRRAGLQLDGNRIVLLREVWLLVITDGPQGTSGNLNGAPQALFLRAAGSAGSTAPASARSASRQPACIRRVLSRADGRCRPPDYRSDLPQQPRHAHGHAGAPPGDVARSALSRRLPPQFTAPSMRFPQLRWCTRLLPDSPTREHSGRNVVIAPNSLRAHRQIDSNPTWLQLAVTGSGHSSTAFSPEYAQHISTANPRKTHILLIRFRKEPFACSIQQLDFIRVTVLPISRTK